MSWGRAPSLNFAHLLQRRPNRWLLFVGLGGLSIIWEQKKEIPPTMCRRCGTKVAWQPGLPSEQSPYHAECLLNPDWRAGESDG